MGFWYTRSVTKILQREAVGAIDLDGDAGLIKMGLSTAAHVPNRDDEFLGLGTGTDFDSNEATGTNYVGTFGGAGRKALTGRSIANDLTLDHTVFDDPADYTWTAYNPTVATAFATVFKELGGLDTTSPLIINLDFAAPIDPNGFDFVVQFNALGIGYIAT